MNEEHRLRRASLLRAMNPGVLVVPAAPVTLRNNDVEHEYRQDSDFYYLTGFEEPDSVLVLSSSAACQAVVFVRPRDPEREAWDGVRLGVERAGEVLGVDAAYPFGELAERLPALLSDHDRLYYRLGVRRTMDDTLLCAIDGIRARARAGARWPTQIIDPSVLVHEMRVIKSPGELAAMGRAVDATCRAHLAAMRAARPGMWEYELEAVLTAEFLRSGCRRSAYAPIVASGSNATVLHYHANSRRMGQDELVLMDAGCECSYYAADVTRTFPVGGRFTSAQRAAYDVVLAAQLAAIEAVRPGTTLEAIHDVARKVLAEGMITLGLLTGPVDRVLEDKSYMRYFRHRTSHWLGMDVHDVGAYQVGGLPRELSEGMVLTVEPGLYVPEDSDVPEALRGIGVRIEDDVLVKCEGGRVLTSGVPKSPDAIEAACR
ncbi:MAG: aminopeptidase P N-terminal domain-containing protein [Polyangiaceae bacterium]|nr:aminopeptidase P N-terminal domain-containing protein [Polyangiaceae bacterium]